MMNRNVMIVEDEPITALDLKANLQAMGYNVVAITSTGEKAVSLALDLKPEAILMDISLAGSLTGIEAAEQIRSSQRIPIIFITAHTDEATIERAIKTNPYGYLFKPVDSGQLKLAIDIALYKSEVETELLTRNRMLEFFYEINSAFVHEDDLTTSLTKCTEAMKRYIGVGISRIWLVSRPDNSLQLVAQSSTIDIPFEKDITFAQGMLQVSRAIEEKRPCFISDISTEEGFYYKDIAIQYGLIRYAGYPLIIDEEAIGAFTMFSQTPFDELIIKGLGFAAQTIALGIKKKQAEQDIKAKNRLLEDINMDLQRVALEQYRLSQEREKMLIQQSKLASMGEMLGAIAHQWKQPLNALALIIQNINEVKTSDEESSRLIEYIIETSMKQIRFMAKTVDDFRNFMRTSADKTTFSVVSAIQDIINMFHSQFRANNIIVNLHAPQEVQAKGHPNEFKHVILNILNNAKDAVIATRQRGDMDRYDSGIIDIHINQSGEHVRIAIGDNAGGIPEDIIGKVFDPYFTTKTEGDGTGLGLYMAKTIIERHMGGRLSVSNTDGGAEFVIEL